MKDLQTSHVVRNKHLKVTVLPNLGARILVEKPRSTKLRYIEVYGAFYTPEEHFKSKLCKIKVDLLIITEPTP